MWLEMDGCAPPSGQKGWVGGWTSPFEIGPSSLPNPTLHPLLVLSNPCKVFLCVYEVFGGFFVFFFPPQMLQK